MKRLRIAVYGILADGVGSGAGTFPVLLEKLLARGHHVAHFGPHGHELGSLARLENFRSVPLYLPRLESLWWKAAALKTPYPLSFVSQLAQIGWQREAVRAIEAAPEPYDLAFCTDAMALWPSRLPILSWPQSPPNTEAAALRTPETMRRVVQTTGAGRYLAVQIFYAYRWLSAAAALRFSDIYLCGSSWAESEWAKFGARRERLRRIAYPIDLEAFVGVPALAAGTRPFTFLWLGRATPRKRLDLFLAGFRALKRRHPAVRARLVGNLRADPSAAPLLATAARDPAFSIEPAIVRAEVPALFGAIDVLVQPSENENFGFSVAEALAAGRPVVLGPTNGTADYVGEAGFVFSRHEPESLADAMERAMNAVAADGPGLSAHARARAREHFTPNAIVERFEAICSDVLAQRASA